MRFARNLPGLVRPWLVRPWLVLHCTVSNSDQLTTTVKFALRVETVFSVVLGLVPDVIPCVMQWKSLHFVDSPRDQQLVFYNSGNSLHSSQVYSTCFKVCAFLVDFPIIWPHFRLYRDTSRRKFIRIPKISTTQQSKERYL